MFGWRVATFGGPEVMEWVEGHRTRSDLRRRR